MSGRQGLVLGFALALVLALGFAGHAVWTALRMAEAPVAVEGWMTPGLVIRTYGIAPDVLAGVLGIAPDAGAGETLAEIAKAQGLPVDDLVARVQAAVRP